MFFLSFLSRGTSRDGTGQAVKIPSRPVAKFWACPVVPLSRDKEEIAVPLSRKVALSRPVGNPTWNTAIEITCCYWLNKRAASLLQSSRNTQPDTAQQQASTEKRIVFMNSVNLWFNTVGQRDDDMIVPLSDGPMFILIDWE